jgi:hypothetical protein
MIYMHNVYTHKHLNPALRIYMYVLNFVHMYVLNF